MWRPQEDKRFLLLLFGFLKQGLFIQNSLCLDSSSLAIRMFSFLLVQKKIPIFHVEIISPSFKLKKEKSECPSWHLLFFKGLNSKIILRLKWNILRCYILPSLLLSPGFPPMPLSPLLLYSPSLPLSFVSFSFSTYHTNVRTDRDRNKRFTTATTPPLHL